MPDREGVILGSQGVPDDFDLLKHGMEMARDNVKDLTEPGEDILPVLMWLGPYGTGVMPLLDMSDDAAKDDLAAMMTTALAVSRAREAVQTTTSWAVQQQLDDNTRRGVVDVRPSEHPDRVECITLMYMKPEDGADKMVRGDLTRYDDKPPTLGEWQIDDSGPMDRIAGRFGEAIHMGMDFAAEMPPELVQIIDEGWAEGRQGNLIERFHNVFVQFAAAMDAMQEAGMSVSQRLKLKPEDDSVSQQLKLHPEDDTARANMPLVDPVNRPEAGNE